MMLLAGYLEVSGYCLESTNHRHCQGDADRKLGPYEVQVMLSARGQPTYDQEPVINATLADLDERAVAAFLQRVRERRSKLRERASEEILHTLKVVVPHPNGNGTYVPTVAGLLVLP